MNWDAFGILTSVACAIHCAVLPLLVSSLPVFGINIVDNLAFEYLMILLAFLIGTFSLWHGYRRHHRSIGPFLLFFVGISLLTAKQVWHSYQLWLVPAALVFIVAAHLKNYRLSRVYRTVRVRDHEG